MENDHLGILLEDMNGKFDLVLEGHQLLKRQGELPARGASHRELPAMARISSLAFDRGFLDAP